MTIDDDTSRLDNVEREIKLVQHSFNTILKLLEDERSVLSMEREKLEKDQLVFENMKKRVEEVNFMKTKKVKLNIGGTIFDTSIETLTCEEGSMLEAMFSGRFRIEKEDDGTSFIDRDPTYFPIILSYLREKKEGKPKISVDSAIAEKLLKEAKFYGLDGLERLIVDSTSLLVSQDGTSKYTNIGTALRDAKPGERIIVQPGTYFESLVIDKDVDIIGEGSGEDVILCFSGDHVVTAMSEKGSLQNIAVSQQGDEYHCLFITKGCITVEGCEFHSCGWACVGISGEKTHPILRRNKVVSSADNGIIILNKGKGVIEENDISGYTLQGIEIREESNPIIRRNYIHDGKDSGIYINTKGRGTIEGNEIYNNDFNGIAIKFEGQPKKVRCNKIHHNKQRGIYISADSTVELELDSNDVHGNGVGDIT